MGYPNTQNNSIFDLSKFGIPNGGRGTGFMSIPSWTGNATPTANFNVDPSAQYFTGGMDASSLGFGNFGSLGNSSDYLSDFIPQFF